jgi:hypothetical protein
MRPIGMVPGFDHRHIDVRQRQSGTDAETVGSISPWCLEIQTDRNYKQPHSSITSTLSHWDRYVVEPPATTALFRPPSRLVLPK